MVQNTESFNLNYPAFLYPGAIFSGYEDFDFYRSESLRLLDYFNTPPEKNCLYQIIIGSAMEEYYNYMKRPIDLQYRQLFPIHIENFIDTYPNNNVKIIIISPDVFFSDDKYVEPTFITI